MITLKLLSKSSVEEVNELLTVSETFYINKRSEIDESTVLMEHAKEKKHQLVRHLSRKINVEEHMPTAVGKEEAERGE